MNRSHCESRHQAREFEMQVGFILVNGGREGERPNHGRAFFMLEDETDSLPVVVLGEL